MFKIFLISILFLFIGCAYNSTPVASIDGYNALGTIAKNGFAIDKSKIKKLDGKRVKVWGYLDYSNIYTCARKQWQFSLKAEKESPAGESIRINTPAKQSFVGVYRRIREMAKTEQNRPVLITGILHTFMAPTNFSTSIGIEIDVSSPDDIEFK